MVQKLQLSSYFFVIIRASLIRQDNTALVFRLFLYVWSKNPVNSRLRKLPEFNLSDAVLFFFGGVGFFGWIFLDELVYLVDFSISKSSFVDAYGVKVMAVDQVSEIDAQILEALQFNGPVVCDVNTHGYHTCEPKIVGQKVPAQNMTSYPSLEKSLKGI